MTRPYKKEVGPSIIRSKVDVAWTLLSGAVYLFWTNIFMRPKWRQRFEVTYSRVVCTICVYVHNHNITEWEPSVFKYFNDYMCLKNGIKVTFRYNLGLCKLSETMVLQTYLILSFKTYSDKDGNSSSRAMLSRGYCNADVKMQCYTCWNKINTILLLYIPIFVFDFSFPVHRVVTTKINDSVMESLIFQVQ